MSTPVDVLCGRIRSLIRENEVRPGDQIGDERSLAASLGVPRSRLRAALDLLESDGLVRWRRAHRAARRVRTGYGGKGP